MRIKNGYVDKSVIISIVVAITVIEIVALLQGFNGILLTTVIAVLAALGGLTLPQLKVKE